MGDDFAEFVPGEAVVERSLQMADQLLFAAEGDQCRTGDQAAVTLRQTRPFPDFAEQHPFAEVDQPRDDIADLLAGRRRLRLRHGFLLCDEAYHREPSTGVSRAGHSFLTSHPCISPDTWSSVNRLWPCS